MSLKFAIFNERFFSLLRQLLYREFVLLHHAEVWEHIKTTKIAGEISVRRLFSRVKTINWVKKIAPERKQNRLSYWLGVVSKVNINYKISLGKGPFVTFFASENDKLAWKKIAPEWKPKRPLYQCCKSLLFILINSNG